jgi:SAM-dependent methyltransferase
VKERAPDFGPTAADYRRHRAGFPPELVERLVESGAVRSGDRTVDLGTGTGSLARLLAPQVASVVGIDPSEALLAQARAIEPSPPNLSFAAGIAERTGLGDGSFDLVTAGQCWHWFDAAPAAAEIRRILCPCGRLVVAHFDWLPLPGNAVEATEALIETHNPGWRFGGGTGIYPRWPTDLATAGFAAIETASFDLAVPYSHEAWVGRVRASAGIGASLPEPEVERFSAQLTEALARRFPADPLEIPHRVWWVRAVSP